MRIGCLQFAPKVGDVSNNLNRADAVLAKADPMALDNLDLLVLPEMAFSGYNFKSLEEIKPYLEPSGSGISSLWARTTALKYDCTVAVGYPEKAHNARRATEERYNSLIMVNGDGETVGNYRKSFLYYTDATWAQEGGGFFSGEFEDFGKVAAGICMDINPYRFEAPWHAFEFAFHVLEIKANLVMLSMAWLTREDASTFTPFPHEPDMETMTYWVQRLEPVIRSENEDEIICIFANRCGIEDDVVYAGTSAVIGVKNGEVSVYGLLGRGVKELLIVNTDLPPFAKLVNRPEFTPTSASDVLSPGPETEYERNKSSAIAVPPARMPSPPPPTRTVRSRSKSTQRDQPERGSLRRRVSPSPSPNQERRPVTVSSEPSVTPAGGQPSTTTDRSIPEPEKSSEYKGCEGGCGGCEEHASEGHVDLSTPTCPSPTPLAVRPKLAISTGPDTLPPLRTKPPPSGMEPGNFFTSRDLCTPPITPFDDFPMSTTRYHWNAPQSAFPASATMHTPEEPVWPVFNGSTKIDFSRTPSRAPPSRPVSRAESRPESRAESRPASRAAHRPASRPASRTREMKAADTEMSEAPKAEQEVIAVAMVPDRPKSPKSRNVSPAREQTSPVSTTSHRSFRSDPGRHLKRTKSLDNVRNSGIADMVTTRSRKDGKQDLLRRIEQLRFDRDTPTKDTDTDTINAIPIAASPSVFQTTFSKSKVKPALPSRSKTEDTVTRPIESQAVAVNNLLKRSKSVSHSNSIPMFQYQGPEIPKHHRNPSRGRGRQSVMPTTTTKRTMASPTDLIDLSPLEDRSKSQSKTAGLPMGYNSVHPDIQALHITEDEAFGYAPAPAKRPASRADSRGRKGSTVNITRRTSSATRERGLSAERGRRVMSPQDLISPVSI
ncbi:Carbon-nitrogen hydrolase [Naviculisporaceae sp. PSN 640]